ncbi:MAG: invasion associated locus B family protein [Pseudomonadota bacterium]|nr:invasion associated locus B family protein [Pseudomonadota bacterium]
MKQETLLPWLFILLIITSLLTSARAADVNKWLGTFQDWHARAYEEGARSGCYIVSKPKSEKGDYTKRGDVYILVSIGPGKKTGIVTLHAGYPFKEDSEVKVDIDGSSQKLFTSNEIAWAYEGQDQKFIERMRIGKRMIVVGFSRRGTKTTDTYSLYGFTQAYETILSHDQCK